MTKKQTCNIGHWSIALLLLQEGWLNATQVEPVPYSGFEKPLAEGRIADVTVSDRKIADRLKAADVRKTTLAAARASRIWWRGRSSKTCAPPGWWRTRS